MHDVSFSTLVSQYFRQCVERGFQKIFDEQRRAAAESIYARQTFTASGKVRSRSQRLQQALDAPQYDIQPVDQGVRVNVDYPLEIRFADMRHLGNARVYNRPIWGTLYRSTFPDIRFEFRDWLRANLKESLMEAYLE